MRKLSLRDWSLAVKLSILITSLVVLTTIVITLLSIWREQKTFRAELEQQATLLLDFLVSDRVDALIFQDVDALADIMERLGQEQRILTSGRFYDQDGRIIADAYNEGIILQFKMSEFGLRLLESDSTVFVWEKEQLLAGRVIVVGRQKLGAVSIGLSTAPLDLKIAAVRNQGIIVAVITAVLGVLIGLLFGNYVISPLRVLVSETERISSGDLSGGISVGTGEEFAILADAMERMRVELQGLYQGLEQQVEDRTRELEIARDQALEASRLKSELLANVSHEFRTPLGVILGYSEMLQEGLYGPFTEEQWKAAEEIIESTDYLTSLITDLLDQAKLEAGQLKLDIMLFNPKDLVARIHSKLDVLAKVKNLDFACEIDPEIPSEVSGDPARVQQILMNLTNNAIKFTEEGKVSVQLFKSDEIHWAIKVSDSGPGIPPEARDYIFEPFRQVDGSTTRKYRGSGLGLSIVNQLTTLMGGGVTVDSELGKGSTFTVVLPISL